jgi:hypothetical protein
MPIICHVGQCVGGAVATGFGSNMQTDQMLTRFQSLVSAARMSAHLADGMLPEIAVAKRHELCPNDYVYEIAENNGHFADDAIGKQSAR